MRLSSSLLLGVVLVAVQVADHGNCGAFQFMSKFKRAPKVDIAAEEQKKDQFGDKKLVVLTGASSGPGLEAATSLLKTGNYHVVAPTPDVDELNSIAQRSNLPNPESFTPLQCDLASFDSVNGFCDEVEEWRGSKEIDRLVCAASVYEPEKSEPKFTKDGHEETMQVNFLSHFLMISRLMEGMKEAKDPRILTVGSITGPDNSVAGDGVYPIADLMDLDGFNAGFSKPVAMADGFGYSAAKAYEDSKLCLIMLAANMLHARYHKLNGISFGSVYPGCMAEPYIFKDGANAELNDQYMEVVTGAGGFVGEDVAGRHIFQAVDDAKCAKSGVYWSWKGEREESQYLGDGGDVYEGDSVALQDIDLAKDLFDAATEITGAAWPKAAVVKSPCPTLMVVGAISKGMIEKEELKRMREMPGFDTGDVPVSRRKKIVAKVDRVVGKVLRNTVGRVTRPVLRFLNRRVLGRLPEEAITGSYQEEKPLKDPTDIEVAISDQLQQDNQIGKTDEELITSLMSDRTVDSEVDENIERRQSVP